MVALKGVFTIASSHRLVGAFSVDVRNHEVVIFDFSDTAHVDESAAMVIEQLMQVATGAQTELIVMGLSGSVLETFIALNVLEHLPQGRSVQTLDEARDIARGLLGVGP